MASIFARRSLRPLFATSLVVGVAASLVESQWGNKEKEGTPYRLYSTTTTKCDAATPVIQHDPSTQGAALPTSEKTELPPLLKNRTWFQKETITTKTKAEEGEHETDIYLVGTHHFDNASAVAATELLVHVKPDVVFVELCQERTRVLTNKQQPRLIPIDPLNNEQSLESLYTKLCKENAGEFIAAHDYVESLPEDDRPILILGDRPMSVTGIRFDDGEKSLSTRSWTNEDLYGSDPPLCIDPDENADARAIAQVYQAWKTQDSFNDFLVHAFVENADITARLWPQPTDIHFPEGTVNHVLVQERDIFMVCKLIQTCRVLKPRHIVAIVGANHLNGMVHLIKAGNIGITIEPEDVLPDLLATEKHPRDDPHTMDLSWTLPTFRKRS